MSADKASLKRHSKASSRTVIIGNVRGLHARAAARLVKVAGRFAAEVTIGKGEQWVSGRSILGLMMLAAAPGNEITLRATGPEAAAAVDALCDLIEGGFEED